MTGPDELDTALDMADALSRAADTLLGMVLVVVALAAVGAAVLVWLP